MTKQAEVLNKFLREEGVLPPEKSSGPEIYDPSPVCKKLDLWWLNGSDRYFWPSSRGTWLDGSASDLRRRLKVEGVRSRAAEGSTCGDLDRTLVHIQEERNVDFAGSLAGYRCGVHELGEIKILVKDSPRLIEPVEGEWPTIRGLVDGLMSEAGYEQALYFYGWLKYAVEAIRSQRSQPGQALVIVGPSDCGKSRLQHHIITPLLGNRSADPCSYMFGKTDFNAELFTSEHLLIEDPPSATDITSRRYFGERLKEFTVNDTHRCHRKNRDALTLRPFWRVSISINDDPEKLKTLPPITPDMEDKLLMLKVRRCEDYWASFANADDPRRAFSEAIARELPAFADFLLGWNVPEQLKSRRFGVKHFHHPFVLSDLFDQEPESLLLSMIDRELFKGVRSGQTWEGSLSDLEQFLKSEECESHSEARKLLSGPSSCGTYIGRLKLKFPDRFIPRRSSTRRRWNILPPDGEAPSPVPYSSEGIPWD
jgi:hypothetical protein